MLFLTTTTTITFIFFTQVFDEFASQEEVWKESLSSVPQKLLDGYNCCILAYGTTGSGKSYTMIGAQQHVQKQQKIETTTEISQTEGMITRTTSQIFERIKQSSSDNIEYTIRCSFVEIYLEKIIDLLQPTNNNDGIFIGKGNDGENCLMGASELCCLDSKDIYALLARGIAVRTQSATQQNQDSSRSHAVFIMKLQQINRNNGTQRISRLYMVDLAGSEQGRTKSSRQLDNPVTMESKMVNASLQSVYNLIRVKLVEQGKEKGRRANPSNAYANVSQLTKLLKPCLGGNFYTTFICTVSPSSYNIGETINTLKFGERVRNLTNSPNKQVDESFESCQKRIVEAEERIENLSNFVTTLAFECRTLRKTGKVRQPHNNQAWETVSKIVKTCEENDCSNLRISVVKKDDIIPEEQDFPVTERELDGKEIR